MKAKSYVLFQRKNEFNSHRCDTEYKSYYLNILGLPCVERIPKSHLQKQNFGLTVIFLNCITSRFVDVSFGFNCMSIHIRIFEWLRSHARPSHG